jgi:predicted DNA-binding protein
MADSKAISIRLPDELLAKVNKLAEEKYKSIAGKPNKSLVVQNALIVYFNTLSDSVLGEKIVTKTDTVSIIDFRELQDFVATLSRDFELLQKSLITASDTVLDFGSIDLAEKVEPKVIDTPVNHQQQNLLTVEVSDFVSHEKGLKGVELSARLGCDNSDLGKKAKSLTREEFANWSRKKDPEGIAWERREDKKYYPLPASLSEGEAEAQSSHP